MSAFIFRKTREVETELSPEEMGVAFAEGDSEQQANFLNAAFEEMESWPDAGGAFQVAYIALQLSEITKNALRELVAHFDEEESND
jgi:hypothetical protein